MNEKKGWAVLALTGPVLAAIGYLWGVVYSNTYLSALGFGSHMQSLSIHEAYVWAYYAGMSVFYRPFKWLTTLPDGVILVSLVLPMSLAALVGWLWDGHRAKTTGQSLSAWVRRWVTPRGRRAISWSLQAGLAVLAPPYAVIFVAAVITMSIAAPYWAAKADVADVWAERRFERWNRATWTTDDGETRTAYVYVCWERECGLLDDSGQSFLVPVERVGVRMGAIIGREGQLRAQ